MGRFFEKIINSSDGFFITATGTSVGKTYISALLLKYTGGLYFKPVQTGAKDSDTVKKLSKLNKKHFSEEIYHFSEAVAPNIAAERNNDVIEIDKIALPNLNEHKSLIIEGAGGIYAPLSNNYFMIDLIKKFSLPAIIVAEDILGTLNHTIMTYKALTENRCKVAYIVLNKYSPESYNFRCLSEIIKIPVLRVPYYKNFPDIHKIREIINESI